MSNRSMRSLQQCLEELRQMKRSTDITIKIDDRKFPVHRTIMEGASPFLKALFASNLSSKKSEYEINKNFVDPSIMEDVLAYIYTSKVTLTDRNVQLISKAAYFLNIPSLLSLCEKFMSQAITSGNALDLYVLSDHLGLDKLRNLVLAHLADNYDEALKNAKLDCFSACGLQRILQEIIDKKNAPNLFQIYFWSILKWLSNDLIWYVIAFFRAIAVMFNLISGSLAASQPMLGEVVAFISDIFRSFDLKMSDKVNAGDLYVFGGTGEFMELVSSVSHLSLETKEWDTCIGMPMAKQAFGSAVSANLIYICGGSSPSGEKLNTVEMFDSLSYRWCELAPMPQARQDCAAAGLGSFVYVSGGFVENGKGDSVIRYSLRRNQWQTVRPMWTIRSKHQLVALNGRLYAIGGIRTKIVEEFNPDTEHWKIVSSTFYEHHHFGAAAHEGRIYICSNEGFEVYIPELGRWKVLTALNNYLGRSLVSVGSELWALGGGKSYISKSIFAYDVASDRWTRYKNMDVARSYHSAFFIPQLQ